MAYSDVAYSLTWHTLTWHALTWHALTWQIEAHLDDAARTLVLYHALVFFRRHEVVHEARQHGRAASDRTSELHPKGTLLPLLPGGQKSLFTPPRPGGLVVTV